MIAYLFTWVFVFAVPWENVVFIPGLGTIGKLCGLLAFGATVLNVLLRARVRKPVAFHWLALTYLAWVFLSAFWAVNTACFPGRGCDVNDTLHTYLEVFVMLWVLWEAAPTRSRVVNLLQAYVLGAYVAVGSTIYNYSTGTGIKRAADRFAATGFDANDLGMVLALALPMAWYIASNTTDAFQRWLNRAYFVAGTVAILLTGSRGALLAALIALSVVPWTLAQVRTGVRVAAVIIMIGAGMAAVRFVPAKSFKRLSTTESEITQGTMNNRLQIWKEGIAVVPMRPLQGYGPAGWRAVLSRRLGIKGAHNTYLAILVEEGLVGLLLYLAIYTAVFRRLLRLHTFERRVGLMLLATLATACIPLDWDTRKAAWMILGLLVGFSDMSVTGVPATGREVLGKALQTGPRFRRPLTRPLPVSAK